MKMLQMAAEIADGMFYLERRKIIHRLVFTRDNETYNDYFRDLAARNCMVSGTEVVKVGDLGMARNVYMTDYYHASRRGPLPIRWMAPEAICDGMFTSHSDVWSFGVVLWEIATLAELPYQGLSNEEVISHVRRGKQLPEVENCPGIFRNLMLECWQVQPSSRPTFLDVCRLVWNDLEKCFEKS